MLQKCHRVLLMSSTVRGNIAPPYCRNPKTPLSIIDNNIRDCLRYRSTFVHQRAAITSTSQIAPFGRD